MRKLSWGAAIMTAMIASSAGAADGPPSAAAGGTTSAVVSAAALAVPLMPALDRVDFVVARPATDDPFNRLKGAIRHRFASTMIDLYPSAATGFHASFGTRFFKRATIRRDQEEATRGLLYTPRMPRGGLGGVRGFRRSTPAATVGYTELLRPNLMVGVEGGALLGRVVQPLPSGRRLAGLPGGGRDRDRAMLANPVLNLTLAYAF